MSFSADMMDFTITSMILLAVRDLIVQLHSTSSPSRLAKVSSELESTLAEPDWLKKVVSSCGNMSDLACRLSLHILRPEWCESGEIWTKNSDDLAHLTETARIIDVFITTNVNRQSPFFISSLRRVRGVMTVILSNNLLSQRLEPISTHHDDLSSNFTGRANNTELSFPARVRERNASTLNRFKEEEEKLMRSTGLEVVEGGLRGLVKKMERIVGFNSRVFHEVYQKSGMMVGS